MDTPFDPRLPQFLCESLLAQYGEADAARIAAGYSARRAATLRVNTLKTTAAGARAALAAAGIETQAVPWYGDALVCAPGAEPALRETALYEKGEIYLQNLSAMLPPLLLAPAAGEDILDMCAAPGGKTTQLAALSGGKARIAACEQDKIRAEKLRYNLAKQGAGSVAVLAGDARKLDALMRFDKILLDAPCSGSGTVLADAPRSYRAFSEALVRNSAKLQGQLLQKALSLLKPGGLLVYSTCSVLAAENEAVLQRALERGVVTLEPAARAGMEALPLLPCAISGALLLCPTETHEGFFAAALRKAK